MNYKKIYNKIIQNRVDNPLKEEYTENHHIIPKSIGGSNDKNNLVKLSAREHFICHYLLAKMYPKESNEWYKMNHAFMFMKCEGLLQYRYFNSRLYEALRGNFSSVMSLAQSGKENSQYGTMWIYNLELKKSKKIPKGEIPDGWFKGRKMNFDNIEKQKFKKDGFIQEFISTSLPKKPKKCKKCGEFQCKKPNICAKHQMINTFIKFLSFDDSVLGSVLFYNEYDNIINKLKSDYFKDNLSIEQIKVKYNFTSNERVRMMFKSLGINRRNSSKAVKNYLRQKNQLKSIKSIK